MDEKKFQFEISFYKLKSWKFIEQNEEDLQNSIYSKKSQKTKPEVMIRDLEQEDIVQFEQQIDKNQEEKEQNNNNNESTEINNEQIQNQQEQQQQNQEQEQIEKEQKIEEEKELAKQRQDKDQKKLQKKQELNEFQQCQILETESYQQENFQLVSTHSQLKGQQQIQLSFDKIEMPNKDEGAVQDNLVQQKNVQQNEQLSESSHQTHSVSSGKKLSSNGTGLKFLDLESSENSSCDGKKQQKEGQKGREKIQIELVGRNFQWSNKKEKLKISCFIDCQIAKLIEKLAQAKLCRQDIELALSENGQNVLDEKKTIQNYGIITGWRLFAFNRLDEDLSVTDSKLGFKVTS